MITSPWTDLLDSLADAIARRSGSGWPGVERATAALDVARADVAEAAVEPFVTVQQIARYCSIDEVDVAILVAAAAAELDPTIHLITGLLSGDDGPGRPTVALVLELVGSAVASVDGLARIGENSLLRRIGLSGNPGQHSPSGAALPGARPRGRGAARRRPAGGVRYGRCSSTPTRSTSPASTPSPGRSRWESGSSGYTPRTGRPVLRWPRRPAGSSRSGGWPPICPCCPGRRPAPKTSPRTPSLPVRNRQPWSPRSVGCCWKPPSAVGCWWRPGSSPRAASSMPSRQLFCQ